MKSSNPEIAAWVEPETILLDADVGSKGEALRRVASTIAASHGLDTAPILRSLERREQAGSTGMGDGFAIPHARIEGLDRPLTLFMRTRSPVDFGAPDRRPVRDFFTILVPAQGDRQLHLDLLALVGMLFSDRAFRDALDAAPDVDAAAAQFRAALARHARIACDH